MFDHVCNLRCNGQTHFHVVYATGEMYSCDDEAITLYALKKYGIVIGSVRRIAEYADYVPYSPTRTKVGHPVTGAYAITYTHIGV